MRHIVLLWLLMAAPLAVGGQVDICYDFEGCGDNSRPVGWGALPNLDYRYVGIMYGDSFAHTGNRALRNWAQTCFTVMPDEGIDYAADSVWLTFWYAVYDRTNSIDVGYLTDATDSSTFHSLVRLHDMGFLHWHFAAVDLSSVPAGARIAFFARDIISFHDAIFYIDDLHLTSSPSAAWGLQVADNRADSVRLEWHMVGSPQLTLSANGTDYHPTGTSLTIPRDADNSFTATLTIQPDSSCQSQQYTEQVPVYRYKEGSCLDAADYYSSMAMPYYGTYVNPYLHTGTRTITEIGGDPLTGIWNGSHNINTNPGPEVNVGSQVFTRIVPLGDSLTLRLANRTGVEESSSMLYTLSVDTAESDLLVVKYTVALATIDNFSSTDPDVVTAARHFDSIYPAYFSIELLDDSLNQLTASSCQRLRLDTYDSTVLWDESNTYFRRRNFTGAAFDLAPYHGHRLHLRITATSGAVFSRWCYAYYNFECTKHNDYSAGCSAGDSVTFTMPYGFRYRWTRNGDPATLDTSRTITVAADSTLYLCQLSDHFNPDCSFTLSRLALPQPQLWITDTVLENDLPYHYHGHTLYGATDTTLVLPAADGCDTTLHLSLHVWENQRVRLVRRVCPDGWPVAWQDHIFDGPDSIVVHLTDLHGADSTVVIVAEDAPTYNIDDTVVICPYAPYVYNGVDYGGPVVIDTLLTTVDGCDSLIHLALLPRDSTFRPELYHSLDGHEWNDSIPVVLCANEALYVHDSTPGATGWQYAVGNGEWRVASGEWSVASGNWGADSIEQPLVTTLTILVTSEYGCVDTVEWPVVVIPAPEVRFAWDPASLVDIDPVARFINYTHPEECEYLWLIQHEEGSDQFDSIPGYEPTYRWEQEDGLPLGERDVRLEASWTFDGAVGNYKIHHTCTDTAQSTVTIVTSFLQFPNVVTPNGDGINDRWEVVNLLELGLYPMNELWIYDAWGLLVHHAKDIKSPSQFWDPTETRSPDGTYYFRFSAKSRQGLIRVNGVIEVVR